MRISQKVSGVIIRNPQHIIFKMTTNIPLNFRICISFPLMNAFDKKCVPAFSYSFLKIDENHVKIQVVFKRNCCLT